MPKKSLAAKQELGVPGFKMSKERLTVLAWSNAAGTNMLSLTVIGKSKKPRAFKNINVNSLPVHYKSQGKAWITSELFKEWFHEQFVPAVKKFSKENDLHVPIRINNLSLAVYELAKKKMQLHVNPGFSHDKKGMRQD